MDGQPVIDTVWRSAAPFIALACLILAACASAWPPGSVSTKVDSQPQAGTVSLHCLASSSGTCHFLVGEAFETRYAVPVGQTLTLPAPDQTLPVCGTHAPGFTWLCNRQTTIGPGTTSHVRSHSLG